MAMSLQPQEIAPVPEETERIARAAFPKGNIYLRLRDEIGTIFDDPMFAPLFPARGQPAECPWQLALITVMQFIEGLSDCQAADAVRSRIDWKYALGLELTDPGGDASVLCEFRARLIAGNLEQALLETMLARFKERGLLKARGQQRTDSTHVLAAVRTLNRLESIGETLRAALNSLATVAPAWLADLVAPDWFERYATRVEEYRLPKGEAARTALGERIGADGHSAPTGIQFWWRFMPRRRRLGCVNSRPSRRSGVPGSTSSISRTMWSVGARPPICLQPGRALTPPTTPMPATAISAAQPGPATRFT
jgi:transposase